MSLPRVLYVGNFPPHPGGSGVIANYLMTGLHEAGYPLSVVTASSPEMADRHDLVQRDYPGIDLVEVPAPQALIQPWGWRLDHPDRLAHVNGVLAGCTTLAKRARHDVVLLGAEFFLDCMLPWAAAHGLPLVSRATAIAMLLAGVYGPAMRRHVFRLMPMASRIVTPAHHLTTTLTQHGLSNVVTIPNPVDATLFRPAATDEELAVRLRLGPDHVVVAHASNFKPVKRVGDILAAADLAVTRDPRLIFLVMGDGEDRASLEVAVRERGLSDHFRITGWVGRDAIAAHLRLAHMALMPSTTEGLSSAYLEAMATALPLLASDVAAAREVIDDGKNGFLFPVGDTTAIADLIVGLAADNELRHRVGRNARAYVERNHRVDVAIDLLRKILADVVRYGGITAAP